MYCTVQYRGAISSMLESRLPLIDGGLEGL